MNLKNSSLLTLTGKRIFGRTEALTFSIPLTDGEYAFMRLNRPGEFCKNRVVVLVDCMKLRKLWAGSVNSNRMDLATGGVEAWVKDYKYVKAAKGFLRGEEDPVPLADVACSELDSYKPVRFPWRIFNKERETSFTFINGITRSIYLFSKGAQFFPVETSACSAELLLRKCGVEHQRAYYFEELFDVG